MIDKKLNDFIEQANIAAAQAKSEGIEFTPGLVRENIERLAVFIGEGPELDYVKETELVTPGHAIPVRVYSPDPASPLPVVLHYHGGGHMCGNIALYDAISRKIAKAGHCIVIAVEYRLAPEFPYPHGINDCQYALEHYQEVLTDIKYNQRLMIAGDSGGGAICTTLASQNLANPAVKIDKQILIYPSVDYTMSSASIEENGTGFLLEKAKIAWYFDHYFQNNETRKEVSPLFMAMDASMPQTLIFTAGCDPLRDEALAYGQALENAGVSVQYHAFDGMIHAYMLLDSLVEQECRQTYQLMGDFIKA